MNYSAVDELLKAEQRANEVIKSAFKEKEKKAKDARIQAEDEIQVYKREKEQEY